MDLQDGGPVTVNCLHTNSVRFGALAAESAPFRPPLGRCFARGKAIPARVLASLLPLAFSAFATPPQPKTLPRLRYALFTVRIRYTGAGPLRRAVVRIPVPAGNDYQQIRSVDIVPRPVRIERAPFGGRVAFLLYRNLAPGQVVWAWMGVSCRLRTFEARPSRRVLPVPWEVHERCLGKSDKLNPFAPRIRRTALQLRAGRRDSFEIIKNIQHFIVAGFTYDLDGKQDDAVTVLQRRSGSCSELSRVFVGLARACGIPARFVAGSVMRRRKHPSVDAVHHRWLEVFLPHYGWFPIDISAAVRARDESKGFGRIPACRLVLTRNAGVENSAWYSNNFVLSKPAAWLETRTRTYWFPAGAPRIPQMLRRLRHARGAERRLRRIRYAAFYWLRGAAAVPFLAAVLYEPLAAGHPETAVAALAATHCRTAFVPLVDYGMAMQPAPPLAAKLLAALNTLSGKTFPNPAAAHDWMISPDGLAYLRGAPLAEKKLRNPEKRPAPPAPGQTAAAPRNPGKRRGAGTGPLEPASHMTNPRESNPARAQPKG